MADKNLGQQSGSGIACCWTQVCTHEVELWGAVDLGCDCCWRLAAGQLDLSRSYPLYRRPHHGERSAATPSRFCVVTASTDWTLTGSFRVHVAVNLEINSSSLYSWKFADLFISRLIDTTRSLYIHCVSKKTGPLRLICHNFTNSQYLLIIFGILFNSQLIR